MRHLAEKAKVVKMRKNPEIGEIRARMPRRARYAPAANAVLGHYGGGGGGGKRGRRTRDGLCERCASE